jgi:hypothetical protein
MKSIIIFTAAILPFAANAASDDSRCTTNHEPVFCTSTPESKDWQKFSNLCLALEAGFDRDNCGPEFSVDPIHPDFSVNPIHPDFTVNPIDPDFSVDPIDPDFSVDPIEPCSTEYKPVDCGQFAPHLFDNICLAEKAGLDPESCNEISIDDSACPTINKPVFCTSTPESKDRNEFSNICLAKEAGFDSENCTPYFIVDPIDPDFGVDPIEPDFSVDPIDPDFSIDPIEPDFSVDPIEPDFSVDPVEPDFRVGPIEFDGECATIHNPVVCTSCPTCEDHNEFSNICFAEEAGFDSDNCGPDFSVDPVGPSMCATIHKPVVCTSCPTCDDHNEFSNICFAEEAGFDGDNCKIDLECPMTYEPVVCTATPDSYDYNKFSNLCEAEKAGFGSDNCTLKTGGLRG